jgi:hypothetical protein
VSGKATVDLTRESLNLAICAVCRALTRDEDIQEHWNYHRRNGELEQ